MATTSDKKCRHCGSVNPISARFCNACGKSLAPPVPFDGLIAEGTLLRGAYVVEDVIGEGGMGVVYRAHHQTLRSRYAIKVLDSKLARHASLRLRFLEEARIQATLSHPNIVRVHDVLDEGGIFGMVMEFIDGRTLDEYIHDEVGQVDLTEAVNLTVALLDAIGHAHRAGVIHRDLKPSNVLLVRGHDPDDIGPDLKVMDFGIAKILSEDGGRTVTGAKMGTPRYMAPEQVRNARDVDGRTDLYAIGLTLYEMVCGRHPYEELRDYDLLKAQVETPPPAPSRYRKDLPSDLERVILKALSKRPEDRFADAEAFIDTLVELDTSSRTHARRSRTRARLAQQSTAAPSQLSSEAAAFDLASAYTAPSDVELEPPPRPDPKKPARRKRPTGVAAAGEEGWSLGDVSVTRGGSRRATPPREPTLAPVDDDDSLAASVAPLDALADASALIEDELDEPAPRPRRVVAEPEARGGGGRWIFRLVVLAALVALCVYGYRAFFGGERASRGKPEPLSRDQVAGGAENEHTLRTAGGGQAAGGRPPIIETTSTTTGRMSRLPAAEAFVGRAPGDTLAASDEAEGRRVAIPALDIDQTEVSVFQYQRCVAEKVCPPLGTDARSPNDPVVGIGYASAETFCQWAGKRLPTEAEWEAAARAGTEAVYPTESVPDCAIANHGTGRGSECVGSNPGRIESVFARETGKNRLHVRQLAGNVWEWTSTEGRSPQERIVKGGSFRSPRAELRISARRSVKANAGDDDVGFRCVRPAQ